MPARFDVLVATSLRWVESRELIVVHHVSFHLIQVGRVLNRESRLHDVLLHLLVELAERPGRIQVDLVVCLFQARVTLGRRLLEVGLLDVHGDEQLQAPVLGRIVARNHGQGRAGPLSGGWMLGREGRLRQARELGRVWLELHALSLLNRSLGLLMLAELV